MSIEKNQDNEQQSDFHGAAIIDKDGKEVPITEGMVQEACQKTDTDEPDDKA